MATVNPLRRNWDRWGGIWDIDYRANIIEKPYSGNQMISTPQREASINGTIEKHVLFHVDDFADLKKWFSDGGKIVRCPIFNTVPIVAGDMQSYLTTESNGLITVGWKYKGVTTPYRFRSMYFIGALANAQGGLLAAPAINTAYDFGVLIRPKTRGFTYTHRTTNMWEVDAIEFYVVPHSGWYIPVI